ncbi:MAG TPA: type II secretion system F family protein [Candidatus Ruania gallistercoris]|uniref:Type II secretion system F family protein n=1 Tax=Candidatus Ruania gallistercoris TaxID=2838746 RepID=A0A9D2J325_9MICO|nr:type II secretion system F family protein [Candidatus Ruania gallistercoris]
MTAPAAVVIVLLSALALLPWACGPRPLGTARDIPDRRPAPVRAVDTAVLLDITRAAIVAGASVPGALAALAAALPPTQGAALGRVETALQLGASWPEAWQDTGQECQELRHALEPAWTDGVSPVPLLHQAADTVRARRTARAREAAARLGVRLVLPLGLCLLPAFVLLGLVPVLLSTGTRLFGG